jgi:hypothetical protein
MALVPRQAEAAGANTLMMTANPDRIIGAGQPHLSKPFCPICSCNGCGKCFRQTDKSSSFEPAYFAGPDSPAVLFAAGSIVASPVNAALIRSISTSDI